MPRYLSTPCAYNSSKGVCSLLTKIEELSSFLHADNRIIEHSNMLERTAFLFIKFIIENFDLNQNESYK
jgi:hypothetical protein